MFAASPSISDQTTFDFESEVNAPKWKGLFVQALQQVQYQVHPSLSAKDDALKYIESLILRLLSMLCASQPHIVSDVEDCVKRNFPHPIDRWAIADAQSAIEKGKKKSPLVLPVDKIHSLLQKEVFAYKIDSQVSLYIVAVLEYISADILKLAGNYVRNIRHTEITCQDIKVAMCADKVLMDMFYQDEDVALSIEEEPINKTSGTYDEIVKDLIYEEKQYLRDLNMIIKVFRDPFVRFLPMNKCDLDVVFSNILDIYDFTVTFLGSIEDTIEVTEENQTLAIGSCFEELAEAAEFDVYEKYAHDILGSYSRDKLFELLQRSEVCNSLQTAGQGFKSAVKYVLPKLQLGPVHHCFLYFEYIKMLKKLTSLKEDRESIEQAEGLLKPLQVELERIFGGIPPRKKFGESTMRIFSRMSRQAAVQKMNELQRSIDGWEGKDIGQCCNEFILDGILGKVGSGKRLTERHVFLFDGLMILCKQNNRRSSVTGPVGDYRLKEKFFIRKIEIVDREESEELKHAFEIAPRDQPHVIFFTKTADEKCTWMAALIMLSTRSMLERTLDSILSEEEKKHPLVLPPPVLYRFAEEDSEMNIVFEVKEITVGVPVIKGATLLKLVERLTYHMYADPMFVRTFLTTFRSFCQPQEMLDLLIERFDIPDPPQPSLEGDDMNLIEKENLKNFIREGLKRFKKEYSQPVQFRVLNVLRHWVDHHFYDFEREPLLLNRLQNFLETVRTKSMRKWVDSITKIIQRRIDNPDELREVSTCYWSTPKVEWHSTRSAELFNLMSLHPIELARQLTLLEFDLYRAVKPSELVGTVWTKKDKNKTSPNLLKMIHQTTNFTLWLEKWVVETKNTEERIAVVSRILEIMLVLQELNNFNGVLEVVSAMNSASVYRLEHTFNGINHKLIKALEDAKELLSDHYKKYQEKLRSVNPPCVPFFGMYLTNILHIEEGNPDFLPNHEGIINFSKRRKVAEITGEIQQFQNQPYCLTLEPDIRHFLEQLNPLGDLSEKQFNDHLYAMSLEVEPRNCKQPAKFARQYPDSYLKSPGIKPRASGRGPHPGPLPSLESTLLRGSPRISEDREPHSPRIHNTPPTPSTPLTPPHSANATVSDSSVFAHVLIPQSGNLSPGPNATGSPLQPPPLPPRRKRETSVGDTSPKVKQAPDAPLLPPRDNSPPPPLPPRNNTVGGTLPRMTTGSNCFRDNLGTLPRRNSALEIASGIIQAPPTVAPRRSSHSSMNGPAVLTPTPVLPPKTYRSFQVNHTNTAPR